MENLSYFGNFVKYFICRQPTKNPLAEFSLLLRDFSDFHAYHAGLRQILSKFSLT